MAYDETLAARVRDLLHDVDVVEKRMFGGLAFMIGGRMALGIVGGELMLKLGDEGAAAALAEEHVREMDFTGRPMRSMVYVSPEGLRDDAQLARWVAAARAWARDGPPPARRAGARGRARGPGASTPRGRAR